MRTMLGHLGRDPVLARSRLACQFLHDLPRRHVLIGVVTGLSPVDNNASDARFGFPPLSEALAGTSSSISPSTRSRTNLKRQMAGREAELRREFAAIKQDLNDGALVNRALQLCTVHGQSPSDLAIKWESFLINEKVGQSSTPTSVLMTRFEEWLKANAVARPSKPARRAFAGARTTDRYVTHLLFSRGLFLCSSLADLCSRLVFFGAISPQRAAAGSTARSGSKEQHPRKGRGGR